MTNAKELRQLRGGGSRIAPVWQIRFAFLWGHPCGGLPKGHAQSFARDLQRVGRMAVTAVRRHRRASLRERAGEVFKDLSKGGATSTWARVLVGKRRMTHCGTLKGAGATCGQESSRFELHGKPHSSWSFGAEVKSFDDEEQIVPANVFTISRTKACSRSCQNRRRRLPMRQPRLQTARRLARMSCSKLLGWAAQILGALLENHGAQDGAFRSDDAWSEETRTSNNLPFTRRW